MCFEDNKLSKVIAYFNYTYTNILIFNCAKRFKRDKNKLVFGSYSFTKSWLGLLKSYYLDLNYKINTKQSEGSKKAAER